MLLSNILFFSNISKSSNQAIVNSKSVEDTELNKAWTNGNFTNYYGEPYIYSLVFDNPADKLYIGGSDGLKIWDIENDTVFVKTEYDGFPSGYLPLDLHNHKLYLGGKYIYEFDIKSNEITNKVKSPQVSGYHDIKIDSINNKLYAITGMGKMDIYDLSNWSIIKKAIPNPSEYYLNPKMAIDSVHDRVYIGSGDGLIEYNMTSGTFKFPSTSYSIRCLDIDMNNNRLYFMETVLGSQGKHSLNILNTETSEITSVSSRVLNDYYCRELLVDSQNNRVFLANSDTSNSRSNDNMLIIYNTKTQEFIGKPEIEDVPNYHIFGLAIDPIKNILYFGGYGLGIYDIQKEDFYKKEIGNGLHNIFIECLSFNDLNKKLYLGTYSYSSEYEHGCLSIFDIYDQTFIHKFDNDNLPTCKGISSLTLDYSENKLYMGMDWNGLVTYDINKDHFIHLNLDNKLFHNGIPGLCIDEKNKKLYMTTSNSLGFYIYNISDNNFTIKTTLNGLDSNKTSAVALDSINNNLYFGCDPDEEYFFDEYYNEKILKYTGGLCIYNIEKETIIIKDKSDGLLSNKINALALDSRSGKLYIGTDNGLDIYNTINDNFENKTVEESFKNNIIHDMIYDSKLDNLYIAASKKINHQYQELGLIILNISTGKIINLNASHGLLNNKIKSLEISLNDNKLFIGTARGLSIFNLKSIDMDDDKYCDITELAEGSDPLDPSSTPNDFDNDYFPDSEDNDIDNDGIINNDDDFPYDPNRWEKEKEKSLEFYIILIIPIIIIFIILFLVAIIKKGKER